jgi:phosphoribosylglycinamide formyltransferase-1
LKAAERNVPAEVIPHRDFPSREAHEEALVAALERAKVEWVCLAGYMRLLSRAFVERFRWRILNIHPSLLPAFPGLEAQKQALEAGVKVSGCTVHFVDEGLDSGPIVLQRAVPVEETDTVETLARRILEAEHTAYPEAFERLLTSPWRIEGRRVRFGSRLA